jgi:predicted metal-dependent peptidase
MFLRNDDKNLSDLYRSIYKESWEDQNVEAPIEPQPKKPEVVGGIRKAALTEEQFIPIRAKLLKAKLIVKQKSPSSWYILENMKLVLHESPKLSTMAVDNLGNIYININFLMVELDLDETAGVLAHEACHIKNRTFSRQRGRHGKLWNYATDYAMNLALLTAGFKLPKMGLIPVLVDGRYHIINEKAGWNIDIHDSSAEQIYHDLWVAIMKKAQEKAEEQEKNKDKNKDKNNDKSEEQDEEDSDGDDSGDEEGDQGGEGEESDSEGSGKSKGKGKGKGKSKSKGNGGEMSDEESDEEGEVGNDDDIDFGDGEESDEEGEGSGGGDFDPNEEESDESGEGDGEGGDEESDEEGKVGKGKSDEEKSAEEIFDDMVDEIGEGEESLDKHITPEEAPEPLEVPTDDGTFTPREGNEKQIQDELEEKIKRADQYENEEEERRNQANPDRSSNGGNSVRTGDIQAKANTNWKPLLRNFLKATQKFEHSYMRPERKYLGLGIAVASKRPAYENNKLEVVIAMDTSGSVIKPIFDTFVEELISIIKTFDKVNMTILLFTDRVYSEIKVNTTGNSSLTKKHIPNSEVAYTLITKKQEAANILKSKIQYDSGGTIVSSIKQYLSSQGINKVKGLLIFTDGYVEENPIMPQTEKVLSLINAGGRVDILKRFGQVQLVDVDHK